MLEQLALALAAGALVSFVLGLVGGGGSMLALPLLIHVVGVRSPHVAIGVSAVAVAVNAAGNLIAHARKGTVKWRCASAFALSGLFGAALGAMLGKRIDGDALVGAFGVVMVVVGALMLRGAKSLGRPEVRLTKTSAPHLAPRLIGTGVMTGTASGLFGIGGGFLITPALIWATDMPIAMAISSSLVAVSVFGLTTATTYAFSGLVDWSVAAAFVVGGFGGGLVGVRVTTLLAARQSALRLFFALLVVAIGVLIAADSFL